MRRFAIATWLALATAAPGCTYITSQELEDKRNGLDEDLDHSPRSSDCDDEDPNRSPDFSEVPYDGVDNDCGGDGDVVDADGDGFPGITADDYGALDVPHREPYPPELVGKPLDCADDPIAHPEAASVFPGNPAEIPYDGLDSDCDRSNDFDADHDGYMPTTALVNGVPVDVATAFQAYVETWDLADQEATWAPPGGNAPLTGDCDDFEPTTHPNPDSLDEPYDGVDLDCDGTNDFDADGDGYMPPEVPLGDTSVLYAEYIAHYFQNDPPWTLPEDVPLPDGSALTAFSDCLDIDNPAIVPIGGKTPSNPAKIFPRPTLASDPWYDGIDTNCWGDDDFDQDLDAFYPDSLPGGEDGVAAYHDYVTNWGYADREAVWGAPAGLAAPGSGDCNDDDSSAYPAALEYVGDGKDQDCDGSNDASRFTFADWTWNHPSAPRISRLGSTYVIGETAERATVEGKVLDQVGLLMAVPVDGARGGALPSVIQFKLSLASQPIGAQLALASVDNNTDLSVSQDGIIDPAAWISTTVTVGTQTFLRGWRVFEDSASGGLVFALPYVVNGTSVYDATSVDSVVNDDAEPYLLSCTPDLLYAIQSLEGQPSEPSLLDATANLGGLCFFNTTPTPVSGDEVAEFTRCNGSKCQDFQLVRSGTTLVVSPGSLTGELWTSALRHGPLQILLDADSTVVRNTLTSNDTLAFVGEDVIAADAMIRASTGTMFAVAIVSDPTDGPVVNLQYQSAVGGGFTELRLPFNHPLLPDVVPTGVALQVDDDRVGVAVSAEDPLGTPDQDTVGWMFLGTP